MLPFSGNNHPRLITTPRGKWNKLFIVWYIIRYERNPNMPAIDISTEVAGHESQWVALTDEENPKLLAWAESLKDLLELLEKNRTKGWRIAFIPDLSRPFVG